MPFDYETFKQGFETQLTTENLSQARYLLANKPEYYEDFLQIAPYLETANEKLDGQTPLAFIQQKVNSTKNPAPEVSALVYLSNSILACHRFNREFVEASTDEEKKAVYQSHLHAESNIIPMNCRYWGGRLKARCYGNLYYTLSLLRATGIQLFLARNFGICSTELEFIPDEPFYERRPTLWLWAEDKCWELLAAALSAYCIPLADLRLKPERGSSAMSTIISHKRWELVDCLPTYLLLDESYRGLREYFEEDTLFEIAKAKHWGLVEKYIGSSKSSGRHREDFLRQVRLGSDRGKNVMRLLVEEPRWDIIIKGLKTGFFQPKDIDSAFENPDFLNLCEIIALHKGSETYLPSLETVLSDPRVKKSQQVTENLCLTYSTIKTLPPELIVNMEEWAEDKEVTLKKMPARKFFPPRAGDVSLTPVFQDYLNVKTLITQIATLAQKSHSSPSRFFKEAILIDPIVENCMKAWLSLPLALRVDLSPGTPERNLFINGTLHAFNQTSDLTRDDFRSTFNYLGECQRARLASEEKTVAAEDLHLEKQPVSRHG